MNEGSVRPDAVVPEAVWSVGRLLRVVADSLAARFNPVTVKGEVSGFSRAVSGHCYFSLKDSAGQIRCAMFRRSAEQLTFAVGDGSQVEVSGRLDVYAPRGDLQLIVEQIRPAGQGALFEQFLILKARLESEGWFSAARKKPLPAFPASVGVVTSLGAAALRDVIAALRRRAPHVPVTVYPASVQGAQASAELVTALRTAYARHSRGECDVLLLVRGGGSIEDLWSFNDEALVRTIAQAPMPVIAGVGHETDFTLADFAADLRAPTPTAAAELCAPAQLQMLQTLNRYQERLAGAVEAALYTHAQRLDRLASRLGRPSVRLHESRQKLLSLEHRLAATSGMRVADGRFRLQRLEVLWRDAASRHVQDQRRRLDLCATALTHLDPRLVLDRGYAYLTNSQGQAVTLARQVSIGDRLAATLADGRLDVLVIDPDKSR
jgi:exodeoxyribonuclease VII large subunit